MIGRSSALRGRSLLKRMMLSPRRVMPSVASSLVTEVFVISEMISPSFNSMTRSPKCSAKSRSWETTTTRRVFERFFKVSKTCFPVLLSRAPVGSSAKMILGFLTRARAMATLCFCPPESSLGFLLPYPSKSTSLRISLIASSVAFLCWSSKAKAMFSLTEKSLRMLYSWKMKPR